MQPYDHQEPTAHALMVGYKVEFERRFQVKQTRDVWRRTFLRFGHYAPLDPDYAGEFLYENFLNLDPFDHYEVYTLDRHPVMLVGHPYHMSWDSWDWLGTFGNRTGFRWEVSEDSWWSLTSFRVAMFHPAVYEWDGRKNTMTGLIKAWRGRKPPASLSLPGSPRTPRMAQAPFSAEQVESLNGFQASGPRHPFVCRVVGCGGILKATTAGWVCPRGCSCDMDWAYKYIADGRWRTLLTQDPNAPAKA